MREGRVVKFRQVLFILAIFQQLAILPFRKRLELLLTRHHLHLNHESLPSLFIPKSARRFFHISGKCLADIPKAVTM